MQNPTFNNIQSSVNLFQCVPCSDKVTRHLYEEFIHLSRLKQNEGTETEGRKTERKKGKKQDIKKERHD